MPTPPRSAPIALLAEDDDSVRLVVAVLLRRQGYTVLEARDGRDALDVAAHHPGPIHLLVTDMQMPRMGGRELAETLLRVRPHVPVLAMSGFTTQLGALQAIPGVRLEFIAKPFGVGQLQAALERLMDDADSATAACRA